jgi:hypothetical protein
MTPGELKEAKKKAKRDARKAVRAKTTKKVPTKSQFGAFFDLATDFRFSIAHLQKRPKK